MNILYLSHLSGAEYAGPTYSVPRQIEEQSKLDNVFWYNAINEEIIKWKGYDYYHDLNDYPKNQIKNLPIPFCKPDLIVVEGFYNMIKSRMINELLVGDVPYVIVPRGELTKQAQARKRVKKTITNFFIAKRYAHKAAAIQYLTKQEQEDSTDKWNRSFFIIPNGVNKATKIKKDFSENIIKCVSIGRIEPYQKGLDLLIGACNLIKEELSAANCTFTIHGPDKEKKMLGLKASVKEMKLDKIIHFEGAVYGKEKEKILLNSDVFIMPSRFEGHPMALVEALSYGLPCIVTTGSNMKEEIEQYNAGWTANNNVNSLRDAILKMINEKSRLQDKARNSLMLSKLFEWNVLAIKSKCCFEKIINKKF